MDRAAKAAACLMPQKTQPRAVFLIGFMGAGKTTVGQALARRLKWHFVDLDERIEARAGRSIARIFAESGEEAFRQAETAALRDLLGKLQVEKPAVIALGGGAPARKENAELLAACGELLVFLDAPFEIVDARCRATGTARPLFGEAESTHQLYENRRPHYLKATLRVDTASQSVEQAAAEIISALSLEARKESR